VHLNVLLEFGQTDGEDRMSYREQAQITQVNAAANSEQANE
jgi:hypothetical protein